jgi:predicted kinase
MAKEWAINFYKSKAWKDNRDSYFKSVYGLCELCERPGEEVHHKTFLTAQNINDVNITMGWDNLILLCKSCHNAQHEKAYNLHREKCRKNPTTSNDTAFDSNGDLVESKKVTIVWGAPGSGKTKHVTEHKGKYDIVVDLDYIMSALSLSNTRARSPDTLPFALDIVARLHQQIADRLYFFEHAWVIVTMPKKTDRDRIAKKLNANIIHIDTDKETCMARAKADTDRTDKTLQYKIITKYFNELEL